MDKIELQRILDKHLMWLEDNNKGQCADLSYAYLSYVDLSYAVLSYVDLSHANLSHANLSYANLSHAVLSGANLNGAVLSYANLSYANLSYAYLNGANLNGAVLSYANLDFSVWPLWCGSREVKIDRKIAAQLAAHFCVLDCDDPDYQAARAAILELAKTSHRAKDLGLIEEIK